MHVTDRAEVGTVVIGGGQAGLAVGYHLRRRGLPFVILDENRRVGAAWRRRWDSLRLFTPARYDALPGMPFPGPGRAYPTKDDLARYLESYARTFDLPIRLGVRVERVASVGGRFEVGGDSQTWTAENVILATGAYHRPRVPPFAAELDGCIAQLHARDYRNPSQIGEGDVLVVGAGNSGSEIALDLARDHRVWLAGRDPGQEPTRAGSVPNRLLTPLLWLMVHRVLTVRTPMGRKVRDHFLNPPRGIPLGRVRKKDLVAAGVRRVPRVAGVNGGAPALEDGRVLDVATVVWCTGFTPGHEGIELPVPSGNGTPAHDRGVVASCPGLYLMGLPFLYSLSSGLVGGVDRDAHHIVEHIARRTA